MLRTFPLQIYLDCLHLAKGLMTQSMLPLVLREPDLRWNQVEEKNGTRRTTGDIRACWYDWMDCQQDARAWKIVESNPSILASKCRFNGYDEHPNDWFRFPGYMQGVQPQCLH